MKEAGVGIVGFGFIGKVHAYAYRNIPFFYEQLPLKTRLVGVCTAHEETAEQAKQLGGFELATTDYHELLARDDIHIINCCTPNYAHRDLLLDAIKAGKHIYCDKPLASNLDEAREIARAAASGSGKYQMTMQYRFVPAVMRAKQLIDEGFLGRIFGFRAAYLHSGYIDPNRPMSWRLDREKSGGGALFDLGSHVIDLIYHLIGDYSSVCAVAETMIKERPLKNEPNKKAKVKVDDVAIMMVRMKNGAIGTIEAWRLATGSNDDLQFEIHGEKGALKFNLMQPNYLFAYDARDAGGELGGNRGYKMIETVHRYPKPAADVASKATFGWFRAHVACLHSFLTHIAEDTAPSPDFEDALRIHEVMDAAYRSSTVSGWINL